MKDIAIIGGGASGLAAAIAAAEHVRGSGNATNVTIYEASDRIGRPILATGNGRCNFSNREIDVDLYHNAPFVRDSFVHFEEWSAEEMRGQVFCNGVVAFFVRHGMLYRAEMDGRLYPLANKASSVLDVLRASAKSARVEEKTDTRIVSVEPPRGEGKPFTLRAVDGAFYRASKVIVACGGSVAREMLPDGLPFNLQRPILCPIATDTTYVRELENIRVKGALELRREDQVIAREDGEIMFRKFGVSGICAFNLSRLAQEGDVLAIDFLPWVEKSNIEDFLTGRRSVLQDTFFDTLKIEDFLRGIVLPRVAEVFAKRIRSNVDAPAGRVAVAEIGSLLKGFELEVKGPGDVEHAQVTRGGFDVHGFDPRTLESRTIPGLYVVGEALDVDGPCGGYNLHWAFSTGILAGVAAAS